MDGKGRDGGEYVFNAIYILPADLYAPGDNFDPSSSHVIPALIRQCPKPKGTDFPKFYSGAPAMQAVNSSMWMTPLGASS